jgi:magnesium transporter
LIEASRWGAGGAQPVGLDELPARLAGPDTLWIDITGPSDDDIRVMREVLRLHPLAIEDTRNQEQRPKVEEYADHLFMILNPASLDDHHGHPAQAAPGARPRGRPDLRPRFRELDVFVGKSHVVTVHPAAEPTIEAVRRRLGGTPVDPGYLLYVLVDVVVDGYFPLLESLSDEIDRLEEHVLKDPRRATLARLFRMKRTLLEIRKVVGPQRDMFNTLARRDLAFIDHDRLQYYLRDVYDHLLRITDMVDTLRDFLTSAVDLYMSAVSNRLNQVINRLTVLTVMIGSLSVITGFYGMNFEATWPPFKAPWGVAFTLGLMSVVVAVMLFVLRRLDPR